MFDGESISFFGKSGSRIICGRVLSQEDFPGGFGQGVL